jgi:hypothetical protein
MAQPVGGTAQELAPLDVRLRASAVVTWRVGGLDLGRLRGFPGGVSLRSAPFTLDDCAWYLLLYPGGDAEEQTEQAEAAAAAKRRANPAYHHTDRDARAEPERFMSLHVCCAARGRDVCVEGDLTLLGPDGRTIDTGGWYDQEDDVDEDGYFNNPYEGEEPPVDINPAGLRLGLWHRGTAAAAAAGVDAADEADVVARISQAISHELLSRGSSKPWYDGDGRLTLRVTLSAGLETGSPAAVVAAPPAAPSALSVQLGALLASGAGTDVSFAPAGDGPPLRAHRWLLAARSSVLAVSLTAPAWNLPRAPIKVPDFDAATFERFLRFLYTEDAALVAARADALALLPAADKYDVHSLRAACEATLATELTPENVTEAFALATRHGAGALKEATAGFIRTHLAEVVATPGWARLVQETPLLQVELVQSLVVPQPGGSAAKRPRQE